MNKRVVKALRRIGSMSIILSILMSCACSSSSKTGEGPTFGIPGTTSDTTGNTSETDTSDTTAPTDPTGSTDPTDPTDPTSSTSVDKKYFGEEATARLHELDDEIFHYGEWDILNMMFYFEDPESYGLAWPETGICGWTDEVYEEDIAFEQYVITSLLEIDDSALSYEDQILYKSMLRDYQLNESFRNEQLYYTSSINDLTGENVEIPILLATMQFDDLDDVERYLTVLDDVKPYFESKFEYEKKRAELGYSYPDAQLESVVQSLEAVYQDHEGNYMYTTFEDRINAMDLDAATKQELIAQNKEILDTSFFPGYEELAENMKTLYGSAQTSGSLSEMEGGQAYYEKYFQYESGTNLSVPEAMDLIEQAMKEYLVEFNDLISNMTYDQLMGVLLGTGPYNVGDFEANLAFCEEKYRDDFPDIGEIEYTLFHIPESMGENFSGAAYMTCPLDDLRKNTVFVNESKDQTEIPVAAHEAFPGHMYEQNYHLINLDNYYMLNGTTAYKEGWSTYSENYIMKYVDCDYNQYRADYVLNSQLMNVYIWSYIDMGFHYYGWDAKECAEHVSTIFEGTILAELYTQDTWEYYAELMIDYCIEIPCYPTPYAFGNYYCCKIINDAVAEYGDEYSIVEIHKAYLDMGVCYYEVLEEYMPLFVEQQH